VVDHCNINLTLIGGISIMEILVYLAPFRPWQTSAVIIGLSCTLKSWVDRRESYLLALYAEKSRNVACILTLLQGRMLYVTKGTAF
jgi:hypothetical protein